MEYKDLTTEQQTQVNNYFTLHNIAIDIFQSMDKTTQDFVLSYIDKNKK